MCVRDHLNIIVVVLTLLYVAPSTSHVPVSSPPTLLHRHPPSSGRDSSRRTFSPYLYDLAAGTHNRVRQLDKTNEKYKVAKAPAQNNPAAESPNYVNSDLIRRLEHRLSMFRYKHPSRGPAIATDAPTTTMTPVPSKLPELPPLLRALWQDAPRRVHTPIRTTETSSAPGKTNDSQRQVNTAYDHAKYTTALPPYNGMGDINSLFNTNYDGNNMYFPYGLFGPMNFPSYSHRSPNTAMNATHTIPSQRDAYTPLSGMSPQVNSADYNEPVSRSNDILSNLSPLGIQSRIPGLGHRNEPIVASAKAGPINADKIMQIVDMLMVTHNLTRVYSVLPGHTNASRTGGSNSKRNHTQKGNGIFGIDQQPNSKRPMIGTTQSQLETSSFPIVPNAQQQALDHIRPAVSVLSPILRSDQPNNANPATAHRYQVGQSAIIHSAVNTGVKPHGTSAQLSSMKNIPRLPKSFIDWFVGAMSTPRLVRIPVNELGNKTKTFVVVPYEEQFNIQV